MVQHLTEDLGIKKIAILFQDDSYGRAGLTGLKKALDKRGLPLLGEATYQRNTVAVKKAVITMRRLKPEAIVMIGAYAPCAEFIKIAKKAGLKKVLFLNISFVGSKALAKNLGAAGDGVVVTQCVPFPWDSTLPGVAEYQKTMKKAYSDFEPGFVSLEGFLSAKTLVHILKKAGNDLSRTSVISTAENLSDYDLGIGDNVTFTSDDHQGFNKVYLTVIKDGKFQPTQKLQQVNN